MPRPVRDLHWSGFHAAPERAWHDLADAFAANAQVGAVTEATGLVAPEDWGTYRARERGAECVILWDRNRYAAVHPESDCGGSASLTSRTFFTGKGNERPGVVATYRLLHDVVDDYDLLRLAAHFPASVQAGDGFSSVVRRVIAWRSAVRGLRRVVLELKGELRPDEITVSFDGNVDLRRKVWRAYLNHAMRGTGLRVVAPTEGTHHDRAIDGFLTTLRHHPHGSGVRVLSKIPGFDHRGAAATLARRAR